MKAETSVGLMILPSLPIAGLYLLVLITGQGGLVFTIFPLSIIATPFILVGCISIFFVRLDRVRKTIFCILSVVIVTLLTWQFVGWIR